MWPEPEIRLMILCSELYTHIEVLDVCEDLEACSSPSTHWSNYYAGHCGLCREIKTEEASREY
jgi:hypothetical protein